MAHMSDKALERIEADIHRIFDRRMPSNDVFRKRVMALRLAEVLLRDAGHEDTANLVRSVIDGLIQDYRGMAPIAPIWSG